jgi:hypothetical protein
MIKAPLAALAIVIGTIAELAGQDVTAVNSRAEQVEVARVKKAAALVPDEDHGAERFFNKAADAGDKLFRGSPYRLQFGGLPGGSGLAVGPVAGWRSPSDLSLNLVTAGSLRGSYKGVAELLKNLPNQSLMMSAEGGYVNAKIFDFYGEGPDSLESNRTRYRKEETSAIFVTRWRPPRQHIALSAEIGGLFYNVGPSTAGGFPSTESVFGPSEAPGIDEQTNYLRSGASIELDFRNLPKKPTKGTRVFLGFRRYADETKEKYSFNRLSAAADYYIPFFNQKRVIALHAATELSYHANDQIVPFYLQPTLGGPEILRGFGRYRFYDNNTLEAIAEYRWEVSTLFEWALFADAGRVFAKPGQIARSSQLKTSAGFGVRFYTRDAVALRLDTGFSNEGFRTWVQVIGVF